MRNKILLVLLVLSLFIPTILGAAASNQVNLESNSKQSGQTINDSDFGTNKSASAIISVSAANSMKEIYFASSMQVGGNTPAWIGILLGIFMGIFVTQLTWRARTRSLRTIATLGAVAGLIIFFVAMIFLSSPYVGEIHSALRLALLLLFAVSAGVGYFHSYMLKLPVVQCALAVLLDIGLAVLLIFAFSLVRDYLSQQMGYSWEITEMLFSYYGRSVGITVLLMLIIRPLLIPRKN